MKVKYLVSSGLILLLLLMGISHVYAAQEGSEAVAVAQVADSDGDGLTDDVDYCPFVYAPGTAYGCPDSDGDGFDDYFDECPFEYAPGTQYGCPQTVPDSDDDGFTDDIDFCPFDYAPDSRDGCPPDTDQDGFYDPYDACPTVPAPNSTNGCPPATEDLNRIDTDKDGIPDSRDRCPTLPAPNSTDGCPPPTPTFTPTFTPAPVSDRDGDTVPDTTDVCPDEKGFPQWGGCADVDGDGLTTQYDKCPTRSGPRENQGCPAAQPPPRPTNTNTPQPSDRDGDGLADDQDECPDQAGPADNFGCPLEDVVIAPSQVDLTAALANCPNLLLDAQNLPIFVQLDIANGGVPDPCAYLQELLASLVFGGEQQGLSEANVNAILENCPQVLPALVAMMDTLQGINANAWGILDSVMTPDNACQLATSIAQQVLPPEFAAALGGSAAGTPVPRRGIVLASHQASPVIAPASAALLDAAIAMCMPGVTPARAALIRGRMQAAAVQDTDVLANTCPLVQWFAISGDITPAQKALIDLLVSQCGLTYLNALQGVITAVVTFNTDVVAVLNLGAAVICANPAAVMAANVINPATDPNISPAMAACPGVAVLLLNYAAELNVYMLWVILNSPNPCVRAANFIQFGTLAPGPMPPPPACFNVPANTVTLSGGATLTGASAWSHKIAVLSRPAATVCDALALPVPDTDGDGKKDDVDACPTQFALSANGCPAPPPNNPPTVNDIPNQSFSVGSIVNVGVVANDPEGSPLAIGAVSGSPGVATVSAAGAVLTLSGIAVGNATITVNVTDGVNVVNKTFNVTVNPPPAQPNAPPTINPIGAQTVEVNKTITVNVVANDPNGTAVTLSAAAADSSIATASMGGTTLTITGKKVGSTLITVIASDGSLTTSIVFSVTVTAAVAQGPGGGGGAGGSQFNKQTVQQQAVASGTPPEQLVFGLLSLPSDEDSEGISAAFQASQGDAQAVKIYLLVDGELKPLFEDTPESHYFPALDPSGNLLIFLTQDTEGNVTLRVYNIEQGASLPLLASTDSLKIGLFPPTWSPDGKQILVTLLDANGVPGVYALSMQDPLHIPPPQLLVNNAVTGNFAPNGRYLAYEAQNTNGQTNIFVMVADKPNVVHPITEQPVGSSCHSPIFGTDSISLFFICGTGEESQLYRYDVKGVEALDLGVATVGNPAPGPGEGFIGFDDGSVIYYGYEDGSNVKPMVRLENMQASNIRWKPINQFQ